MDAGVLTEAILSATGLTAQDVSVIVSDPNDRSKWRVEFLTVVIEAQTASAANVIATISM